MKYDNFCVIYVCCVRSWVVLLCSCINTALWRKLLRKLELRIWPKLWPWLPFSQARIISDENIWMLPPFQFHFQFIYEYELKTVFCSSRNCQRISSNSHRLRKECEGNWEDQLNLALNLNILSDPGYKNIWKIFSYFKC